MSEAFEKWMLTIPPEVLLTFRKAGITDNQLRQFGNKLWNAAVERCAEVARLNKIATQVPKYHRAETHYVYGLDVSEAIEKEKVK